MPQTSRTGNGATTTDSLALVHATQSRAKPLASAASVDRYGVGYAAGYAQGFIDGVASVRPDPNPPVVTIVSPTPNTTPGSVGAFPSNFQTAKDTPIVITATDLNPGVVYICVTAVFLDGSIEEVYRHGSFVGKYVTNSFQGAISNGSQLSIRRDGGWPGASSSALNLAVGLIIDAIDGAGNITSTTKYWQMPPTVVSGIIVANPENVTPTALDIAGEAISHLIWQFRSNE